MSIIHFATGRGIGPYVLTFFIICIWHWKTNMHELLSPTQVWSQHKLTWQMLLVQQEMPSTAWFYLLMGEGTWQTGIRDEHAGDTKIPLAFSPGFKPVFKMPSHWCLYPPPLPLSRTTFILSKAKGAIQQVDMFLACGWPGIQALASHTILSDPSHL